VEKSHVLRWTPPLSTSLAQPMHLVYGGLLEAHGLSLQSDKRATGLYLAGDRFSAIAGSPAI
jgi:hypothetical protein